MKSRFVIGLLFWGIAWFLTAAPADAAARNPRGRNGDNDRSDQPLSGTMYVKKQGDDLYISAKMDARTDILYWFKRCMFNELYTFYRVGLLRNADPAPTPAPDTEPETVLNLAYSDNIGPFAVAGCGWSGANHKYRERTARTAYNINYAVEADGRHIGRDTLLAADAVTVRVKNIILDPSRPYESPDGTERLRDTLCRETVTYLIHGNSIEVAAAHRFCNREPVTIATYYGMQSMFEGETHTLTPGGAYGDWTKNRKEDLTFTKGDYPAFRRFVEKNGTAYQSTFLLGDGLGDHEWLGERDIVFIRASYGKSYHKLIADKRVKNGDETHWKGVYTWFAAPLFDDAALLCYTGTVEGRPALYIDCKKACERALTLPAPLDARHYELLDTYGDIRISADGRRTLKVSSPSSGGSVLLLRRN